MSRDRNNMSMNETNRNAIINNYNSWLESKIILNELDSFTDSNFIIIDYKQLNSHGYCIVLDVRQKTFRFKPISTPVNSHKYILVERSHIPLRALATLKENHNTLQQNYTSYNGRGRKKRKIINQNGYI